LYYEDITGEVQWQVNPAAVGDVVAGLFTGREAGTADVTASLGEVTSDATQVRVVTEPTIVSLSIYARNWGYPAVDGGPVRGGADAGAPCFDCGYALTVLRGDEVPFGATAQYDTGEWADVTALVTWRSSDDTVATIAAGGLMQAVAGGTARIDAMLGEVTSNPVDVRVVNEATLQYLSIYPEGTDRVVPVGGQIFFHAIGSYDVGFAREVTDEATWRSTDDAVGGFDQAGVFTGRTAGIVQVWAELAGVQSERFTLEVYATSTLDYCDPANVNRGMWADNFNRVVLESDCATYTQPGLVTLRYTVTETQPHGGIFDPCLDLYVYQGDRRVRTIREEGCGDPFLGAGAPSRDEAVLRYQLLAYWDLKDAGGNPVPEGEYTIYGRFYLYYDPVVSIDVRVGAPDGGPAPTPRPTPTPDPQEAGCFISGLGLDSCTDTVLRGLSRRTCCAYARSGLGPFGVRWCEAFDPTTGRCLDDACVPPCEGTCCPAGAFCPPGVPPCEPQPDCCPAGQSCIPELPPCPDTCCPKDAICMEPLPPCEPMPCCPRGTTCRADIPPCDPPPVCAGIAGIPCPDGFACDLRDPSCQIVDLGGQCVPSGDACPEIYAPVCGCDGVTYSNDCERLRAGATLAHPGTCDGSPACGGIGGLSCPMGQTCDLRDPTCQIVDLGGRCVPSGDGCPAVFEPVCGCDGVTYSNDCERLRAGAVLAFAGACDATRTCGGIGGTVCPEGQACDLRDPTCQTADLAGQCVAAPDACVEVFAPVCGCDDVTYDNDCFRVKAGATLRHPGPCGQCCPPGDDCAPLGLPPCVGV
jgi:hypothetical protein